MANGLIHLFFAGAIGIVPLILLLVLFAALGDKKSEDALNFGCGFIIVVIVIVVVLFLTH